MAVSDDAAIKAFPGRCFAANDVTQDYHIVLPALPKSVAFINTLFLHCDIAGSPYRIVDFKTRLQTSGVLQDLKACGPYKMSHFWAVTFHTQASKIKLLELKELKVMGRRCLELDPNKAEIRLKLRWLPSEVPDDIVRKALDPLGRVEGVEGVLARRRFQRRRIDYMVSTTDAQ